MLMGKGGFGGKMSVLWRLESVVWFALKSSVLCLGWMFVEVDFCIPG